jgi:fibronectin-binding autotransporter adhesin
MRTNQSDQKTHLRRSKSACRFPTRLGFAALVAAATAVPLRAADMNWDNGSSNFLWNTASLNWTGAAWNNAAGDGAIFGATGVGAINVPSPINVNSMNFTVDGYSLNGAGPITFVNGTSTQTTGVVAVGTASTAQISVPISSSVGFQKLGAGTLVLNNSGNNFITTGIPLDSRGTVVADLLVGGAFGTLNGGFLKLASASAMPANTRVSIGTGYLDIGSNNVTLAQLNYINQNPPANWNTTLNANNGVIGSGTLRVTGDITVMGQAGDNSSNTIASNVDLGGGTQVVRIGVASQFTLNSALIFTGNLSNGSLLKTIGYNFNGVQTTTDGMSLFGNNTYTGPTILNGGQSVIAGTNATSLIKIAGTFGQAAISNLSLLGANGSAQAATTIQAFAGGNFILDNNASTGDSSLLFGPPVAAAQNNDRIRDDAQVQLRDGNFAYRGRSAVAATETFGSLNILGGHNILTVTPNGVGGTAVLTAAGNLTMSPRSTMLISSASLSTAAKVFFNGTIPTADATGILPRDVGTNDFITYNGATGMTPFTGYAADFSTPGTNVAITSATNVATSVNVNALKRTGSFTLTVGAGQTLGITSGMILNTSGTGTITGGTVAFGPNPGVLFGTNVISSAITGSDGLIMANGTGTVSGDMSGLTGTLDVYSATANINTNTFTGPIKNRNGFLNLNVSQTGAGLGAITLGVAENDSNILGTNPALSISGAGANATIARDLIVDNGATNAAGVVLRYNQYPGLSPLSNSTGSQTWSGNVILNTSLRLQGGGASATSTGATVFSGNISGPGTFFVANGRAIFSGNYSNAGGFYLGDQGFTEKVSFVGTPVGSAPLTVSGGNSNTVSYNAGALPTGLLRVWNSLGTTAPQIIPLQNSTINNTIFLDGSTASGGGDAIANVGAGISATWAGPLTGVGVLTKIGTGELVLSNPSSTQTGGVTVSAGTLKVNGALPAGDNVTVATGGTLGGIGAIAGNVSVNSGGLIAPGNSIGSLGTGNLSITGGLNEEIDMNGGGTGSADLLNVAGTVGLTNATLNLSLSNPALTGSLQYLLVANDGADPVTGTFGSIAGLPAGYTATIDYAFTGADSAGRVGNGNDIAVTVVTPEPGAAVLMLAGGLNSFRRRKRR